MWGKLEIVYPLELMSMNNPDNSPLPVTIHSKSHLFPPLLPGPSPLVTVIHSVTAGPFTQNVYMHLLAINNNIKGKPGKVKCVKMEYR